MDLETKLCAKCKIELPKSDFYFDKRKQKLFSYCKKCHGAIVVAWGKANIEKRHAINRKGHQKYHYQAKKYGLTPAQYAERSAAQNHLCKICGQPETHKKSGRLSIDHNHITSYVRGLICDSCNVGLGRFKDSPELLRQAAAYLENAQLEELALVQEGGALALVSD